MNNIYINKSKALSSSLVERVGASTALNAFVPLKDVAEALALKSTRSLRLELNKPESKYISREVQVNGGTSYEILFSSLEPELQYKLRKNGNKTTALVPLNYQPPQFVSDQAKMTANFRLNIVMAFIKFSKNYSTKKQAYCDFIDLYNTGLYLPKAHKFIGNISVGTLKRWNAIDKSIFKADDVTLPEMSVKPYIQYGIGLQKRWGDRFTGYMQAMARSGGRIGVALSAGFRWSVGKNTKNKSIVPSKSIKQISVKTKESVKENNKELKPQKQKLQKKQGFLPDYSVT